MTFTPIDIADFLPGEPATSAQGIALYENPIAIAAGDADAPRIAIKTGGGAVTSSNLTFTGLDDGYKGCVIHGHFKSDGASRTLSVSLSSDGVTFGAASAAISDTSGNATGFTLIVNFANGALKCTHHANAAPAYVTATVAGSGPNVQAIRLTVAAATTVSAIIIGTGGESIA